MPYRLPPPLFACVAFALLFGATGCEDTPASVPEIPPEPPATPAAKITLEKIADVGIPFLPNGVAITSDGAYVVTTGNVATVSLDGETYREIASMNAHKSWGIVLGPENESSVIVSRQHFSLTHRVPGLELISDRTGPHARILARDHAGTHYYTIGWGREGKGLFKMDTVGKVLAYIPTRFVDTPAVGLTPDESFFLAQEPPAPDLSESPGLFVVDAEEFSIVRRIPLDHWYDAMVPLPDSRRAVLLRADRDEHSRQFVEARVIDVISGTAGRTERVDGGPRDLFAHFGWGNPASYVGPDVIVGGSTLGLVVIDAWSGRIEKVLADVPPWPASRCCSVAYDAVRSRLLLVGQSVGEGEGRLVAYRVKWR